ncbi:MAG: PAS domain S-box protein [Candidatus Zixiibacteriota bacterium]|nr:MAG: PAS domain S-box protein [candidate division Zixibacteria bacterium]
MQSGDISIKAGWFLSLRLTTYVLISGIVIYWMRYPDLLSFPFFAYSLLTLMLPTLFLIKRWFDIRLLLKTIPIIQIIFEIIVEVGIIYITGNISSAFAGLFILTIISAALATSLAGTLTIASLVSISYSFVVWFGLALAGEPGSSSRALETIFSSEDAAFYNIFLHILTFFLVAFISGYLVERLKVRDRELADTSQALRQAKLETDDILKHLNSGLFTIDREGRIIFFNRAAEEILGYPEAEAKGQDFRDIFSDRMPLLAENLLKVLTTRKGLPRSELQIANDQGRTIPIGISTSLLLDAQRRIRGVIAIFQDLSETKKLEEKIRAADKMAVVGELSAAIAHEIRNPLAAISGSVEVLQGELSLEGENERLMGLIVRESNRLNNILSDFLLYARGQRSAFTRVELCHLVGEVIDVIKHDPSCEANIRLAVTANDSCVYVYGDEDQIKQIFINLIINACEAFENGPGEVMIEIEKADSGGVVVGISDNGPGIEESIRSRIFDPFYSTKKSGTGLGLAIVQRLAGNLDIDLSFTTRPGTGTTFILKFSQVPASAQVENRSDTVCAASS